MLVEERIFEKKKLIYHLFFPLGTLILMWIVKLFEWEFDISLHEFGIFPGDFNSLLGVITMPFIHGDWLHLFSNSFPYFFLGYGILYFLRDTGYRAILIIWLGTGILTWLIGRENWHIGASGLVYGYAFFLFFAGVLSGNTKLWAISLLVAFLYGGIIWGLFPYDPKMSYEGHASGAISGVLAALLYRNKLPKRVRYEWEDEEDELDMKEVDEMLDNLIEKQTKEKERF